MGETTRMSYDDCCSISMLAQHIAIKRPRKTH